MAPRSTPTFVPAPAQVVGALRPSSPVVCPAPTGLTRRRRTRAAFAACASAADESLSSPAPATPSVPTRVYEKVDWPVVESMCGELAARLRTKRFDVVLAVTRGGMVPATLLAQALELRNVLSATVIFYTDIGDQFFGMAEPRFLSFPSADSLEGRHVLVVDDVWDSGRTAVAVRRRAERALPASVTLAVLHYKPNETVFADTKPDYYASETDNWIVYPWEGMSPHFAESSGSE